MSTISFKRRHEYTDEIDLLVDGVKVGFVRKRVEWEVCPGRRGALRSYYDVAMLATQRQNRIASASTRKAAVAEALVSVGLDEAALVSDPASARFYAAKLGRTI